MWKIPIPVGDTQSFSQNVWFECLHTQFTAQIYSSLWSGNKIGNPIWTDWLCAVTTRNNFEEKNDDGGDKIWLIQQNILDIVL